MAQTRRRRKAPTKKKAEKATPKRPRSLDTLGAVPDAAPAPEEPTSAVEWRFVAFGDLHVQTSTIDRALDVLQRVRELAIAHRARIVCLGDFWHSRGNLNVRQLDAVLDELSLWGTNGLDAIFVPGNHDQVTVNGLVHGVRVFDAFPHIQVATEPLLLSPEQIVCVPWREEPEAQAALFAKVPMGWTVFAHAEAPGATANSGSKMAGRFRLEGPRAIYLGHFHKRQLIGDRCWYIGSPFEMDMGERGDPHGVALLTHDKREPAWIDWDDFPKHHRFVHGEDWGVKYVRPHDIVEVQAAPDEIGTEELRKALAELPAADVRTLPVRNGKGSEVPQFALTLDQALESWVDETTIGPNDQKLSLERAVRLKTLGRELLRNVPEARAIVPLSPYVSIESVTATDFLAVRGTVEFRLPSGQALIRGPMGAGKTSLMDAMTWCLFGSTTPRKPGVHGASLRADEVVHDDADACSVSVLVRLQDDTEITIERSKKRGSGARVVVAGVESGISDQQEAIHRVIGIDHELWRACVYLGQGAVGTFVTDADKRRKDLLAVAFGLHACPSAQKLARDRYKQLSVKIEKLRVECAGDERALEVLRETDYTEHVAMWDRERTQRLAAIQAAGESAKTLMAECDSHLSGEEQWLATKAQHEAHIDKLTKSLAESAPAVQAAGLQRDYGAIEAERALVQRDLNRAREELRQHNERAAGGAATCPTCGQALDASKAEQHVQELEQRVLSTQQELQTFQVKLANIGERLDQVNTQGSAQREGIEREIAESRESIAKCGAALNTLARLKANKADAERRLHEARAEYTKAEREANPYLAQQAEKEERVKTIEAKLRADHAELHAASQDQEEFAFWDRGFGQKGIPVLVLRAALHELESYANRFMAQLLHGRVYCRLAMDTDDLRVLFYEYDEVTQQARERRYEQLSGGQRRCVELAFNPFALSEMIFGRCGVRLSLLVVDELTTHLGQEEKPIICDVLRSLERDTVIVIDHDPTVQGEFDQVYDVSRADGVLQIEKATA
jgi:DNA repair exonuclease SbcCD ATPase subunit/DNA repair exonuclease SbcCD nuclease subunit